VDDERRPEQPRKKRSFLKRGKLLFLHAAASGLSLVETRVLIALFLHADATTGECWPGVRTLARFGGSGAASRPQRVRAALRRLEELQFAERLTEGGGRRRTARRKIIFPVVDDDPRNGCRADTQSGERETGVAVSKSGVGPSRKRVSARAAERVSARHPEVPEEKNQTGRTSPKNRKGRSAAARRDSLREEDQDVTVWKRKGDGYVRVRP